MLERNRPTKADLCWDINSHTVARRRLRLVRRTQSERDKQRSKPGSRRYDADRSAKTTSSPACRAGRPSCTKAHDASILL